MSDATLWKVFAILVLWIGLAVLRTSVGRNDQKAWPMGWLATFCAWLVVETPAVAILAAYGLLTNAAPPLPVVVVWFLVAGSVSWKWGAHFPVVGKWVRVLNAREDERADKGLL